MFFLLLVSFVSFAESGYRKGTVEYVRVHGAAEHSAWAPPIFWFTLDGVASAGSCKAYHGNVLFVMDSQAALSLVLAAEMSGREISVRYDDAILNVEDYWCKATYVTIGDPALLN
jgi:hypothetical protein